MVKRGGGRSPHRPAGCRQWRIVLLESVQRFIQRRTASGLSTHVTAFEAVLKRPGGAGRPPEGRPPKGAAQTAIGRWVKWFTQKHTPPHNPRRTL